jgi:hypothetical protein
MPSVKYGSPPPLRPLVVAPTPGKIVAIDAVADPEQLARLELTMFD